MSSLEMEVRAVMEALVWLASEVKTQSCILSDSMSMLHKVQVGMVRQQWEGVLQNPRTRKITLIFVPEHDLLTMGRSATEFDKEDRTYICDWAWFDDNRKKCYFSSRTRKIALIFVPRPDLLTMGRCGTELQNKEDCTHLCDWTWFYNNGKKCYRVPWQGRSHLSKCDLPCPFFVQCFVPGHASVKRNWTRELFYKYCSNIWQFIGLSWHTLSPEIPRSSGRPSYVQDIVIFINVENMHQDQCSLHRRQQDNGWLLNQHRTDTITATCWWICWDRIRAPMGMSIVWWCSSYHNS